MMTTAHPKARVLRSLQVANAIALTGNTLPSASDFAAQLVNAACAVTGISEGLMQGRDRSARVAFVRQCVMRLMREAGFTFNEIAAALNRGHHGTVMHGCRVIDQCLTTEKDRERQPVTAILKAFRERAGIRDHCPNSPAPRAREESEP
jgi:chromosomal replication initiation ATPase DnaA